LELFGLVVEKLDPDASGRTCGPAEANFLVGEEAYDRAGQPEAVEDEANGSDQLICLYLANII